ncbi:MAG TPA: SMC-Scp complex subunit ScpB [Planosporangium sp.]|nr:SMC-Scp complex subunit ScpB [Planosporangium sp.]
MSDDDAAARSLAEQAATWVPPWERESSAEHPAEPAAEAADEPAAEPDVEPAADAEAEPADLPPAWAGLANLGWRERPVEPSASTDAEDSASSAILVTPVSNAMSELPRSEEAAGEADAAGQADAAGEADAAPEPEPEPAEAPNRALLEDPAEVRGAIEAILLVIDEPVSEIMLAQVLDLPRERIRGALDELAAEYAEHRRGFELRPAAGGWRLYTRGDYAAYVERFVLDGQQARLTQAALETLAVIAYKQPVTRSRISAIRGVNCDGVVRTLLSRGLIEDCGSEPDSGAFLYRTTPLFLEKLGINSVEDLPPLAPFLPDDVDEIANAQG